MKTIDDLDITLKQGADQTNMQHFVQLRFEYEFVIVKNPVPLLYIYY